MAIEEYNNRFAGVKRIYGDANVSVFNSSHVMVVGIGGVGSWTVEALSRSGVGHISLVDLDDICVSNTNRQVHALNGNYGKMKAHVMKDRIRQINSDCEVSVYDMFYSERTSSLILDSTPDIVVDAIDSMAAKCHLIASCKERNLPIVVCGGAGGRQDLTRIKTGDLAQAHGDKLISSVRSRLRSHYGFPKGGGKKVKKFKVPAVFSDEPMTLPSTCNVDEDISNAPRNLNCASGYGAVTHVTATFGLALAQLALEHLRDSQQAS